MEKVIFKRASLSAAVVAALLAPGMASAAQDMMSPDYGKSYEAFIDEGKLDAANEINTEVLLASGLVRRALDGIRVLAKGEIKSAVKLNVQGASAAAVEAVAKAGGSLAVAPELAPHGKSVRKAA